MEGYSEGEGKDGNKRQIPRVPAGRKPDGRGYGRHSSPASAGAGANLNPANSCLRAKKFAIHTRIPAKPSMTCGTHM
jgi:hypothetical protein